MRIALVTELFYPHMAGTERRFFEIGKRLALRGHEVHVFTVRYNNDLPEKETIEGMLVHRYAYSKNYLLPKGSRSPNGILKYSFLTLVRLLGQHFDICYLNEWPLLHSVFVRPVASCLVQEWCEVWTNSVKVTFLQRILKKLGNYHVAVSEFTGQRLVNFLKVNPQKVAVIPNGVDSFKFRGDLSTKIWGRIIYVGRLVPHKHVELLIDAFRIVKENIPEAELHIVGDGPLLSPIREKASRIKDCFVHGFLSERDMRDLLKTAWVFVLPSEREGFNIGALEAMATGVPVITVDFPDNAAKEFAQFDCCQVTKPNSQSIASSILGLLNNEEVWTKISQNALRFAKKYDWDTVSGQMEDLMYKMVCDA